LESATKTHNSSPEEEGASGDIQAPMQIDSSLTLEQAKSNLLLAQHKLTQVNDKCAREFKTCTLLTQRHDFEMREYKSLLRIHDQWVSILKQNVDPVLESVTLKGCCSLVAMLDTLFKHCNSKSKVTMQAEWDKLWRSTERNFPIDLKLWHDLRERYFLIYQGNLADLDKQLGTVFKSRLLQVVPRDVQEYGPLLLAIHSDRDTNEFTAEKLLLDIQQCEADKHANQSFQSPPNIKLMGQKRKIDGISGKYCSHHKTDSHSNEECHFLQKKKKETGAPRKSKQQLRSKGKNQPATGTASPHGKQS
jgi:hypothetical protein